MDVHEPPPDREREISQAKGAALVDTILLLGTVLATASASVGYVGLSLFRKWAAFAHANVRLRTGSGEPVLGRLNKRGQGRGERAGSGC